MVGRWIQFIRILGRNFKDDIVNNLCGRSPFLVIAYPDSFEPPFTNTFNEYFNVSSTAIINEYSSINIVNYSIISLSIFLAGLDIIYSIFRLLISTFLIGALVGSIVFFGLWFTVTATRRWKLIILMIQNNEFTGIW
ncbi:hypothetical protein SBY92_000129 [Candida maltosa Xu316]